MLLDRICKLFRRKKRESVVMKKVEEPPQEPPRLDCGTGMTSSSWQTVIHQPESYRESWNGEPPASSWSDAFDLRCHRVPPPFERRSAPPAGEPQRRPSQGISSPHNFVLTAELARLQDENDKLADFVEKTDRQLSQLRHAKAEEDEALEVVQQALYARQDEVIHLRRENQRLRLITEGLISTQKDSKKTLKAKLADAELRASRDKAEINKLKAALQTTQHQKEDLEKDAWELWDAIIATGAQAGTEDRRARAMSRMSLRFE